MDELQSEVQREKEWWEKKRAGIQSDFMKELDEGSVAGSASAGVSSPTTTSGIVSPKGVQEAQGVPSTGKGSDDDAVMVEAGGPAVNQQGGGGKKKKKGKH